jgi:hypothetical protein
MDMGLSDYIEVYDMLEQEDDIDKLRNQAKYLLVGRAMNDKNLSEDEAIALAEYATVDIGVAEEITVH